MKVVHLIKSLGRGGAEVLLSEGYKAADHEHFELEYAYYLSQHDEIARLLRSQGARVHAFDSGGTLGMLRAVRQTARYLTQTRADIVHAHLPLAGVVGRFAGRLAGVPVVYTEHSPTNAYHPVTRALSWATWGLQDEAIAISEDVADSMRRHGGRRAPIRIVPNGIDTDRFCPSGTPRGEALARIGLPAEASVVGVVAQFVPQKQLDVWLDTARLIRETVPEARFVIVGDGLLAENLRAHASRLGLDGVVQFAGVQADVRPYVEAMDVFMMASKSEGAPLAPVEAMALGVPVVAFAAPGVRNTVTSGEDGVLVPPGAADALARETAALLRDPDARHRMGEAGRQTALSRYSLPQMQRALEAIYVERVRSYRGARLHQI